MVRRPLAVLVFLLISLSVIPSAAFAQIEATLSGTVADEQKGVLPGVTVTATEVASGRQYVSVTDDRGEYRLPSVLPGTYRVQAELSGFSTVVIPQVELLVGQSASLPVTLKVASLQETLTVTGEAPLINTQSVEVGGNIDRRQMESLPIQGRNWMELSMLVKGVTANDVGSNRAGAAREDQLQLNLDGQQITQQVAGSGFGQPGMSREAIAEYQVLTNMFDVTMGRSVGMQVQAVSRAGTNSLAGSVYGYFRDDSFTAKDFVANKVLPYSNQQSGFSLGGPILRDKLHYFATYEYEREPQTVLTSPISGQSLSLPTTKKQHSFLARGDYQLSAKDHIVARGTYSNFKNPFTQIAGTELPNAAADHWRYSAIFTANWSRVLNNNAVQEVRGGYYYYYWLYGLGEGVPAVPNYQIPGFSIVSKFFYPEDFWQKMPSARYDLNWHKGAHDLKFGGEYLHRTDGGWWPVNRRGQFVFSSTPSQAELARRFPIDSWNDPSRWDFSGLEPTLVRYAASFSRSDDIYIPRKTWALWVGDTWAINDRLTLNAGVRWDADWGALDPPGPGDTEFQDRTLIINNGFDVNRDVGYKTGIRDLSNVAPRVGATYKVNDTLVLRGGGGLFFATQVSNLTFNNQLTNGQNVLAVQIPYDRQPGFLQDPLRGRTGEDFLSGRFPSPPQNMVVMDPDYVNPRTFQINGGFQKQIGTSFGFDSDLTFVKGYNLALQRDVNLFFDPVTGTPKHPNVAGRPLPQNGSITIYESLLKSESLQLASSFTRRFKDRWQAGLTYTTMFFNRDHGTGSSGWMATINNPFCTECEWGRANALQRHTLRVNGVYQMPWDIQASGVFSFGSGTYFPTTYAGNPFGTATGVSGINRINTGTAAVTIPETAQVIGADGQPFRTIDVRDRFDGDTTIDPGEHITRNALRGMPLAKLDVRFAKDINVPGSSVKLTGILEVFNVLNHANYGDYNGIVGNAGFGRPVQLANLAYYPRVLQLAFRVGF